MEIRGAERLKSIPDEYLFNALDAAKKKKEAEGVKVISLDGLVILIVRFRNIL